MSNISASNLDHPLVLVKILRALDDRIKALEEELERYKRPLDVRSTTYLPGINSNSGNSGSL